MNPDTDYTYDININPPAGITSVESAIVTFQMWLNPTIEFFLTVNDQTCNTESYEVHTTYAGAGEGTIFFDCSNIITGKGTYQVILTPDDDTGAVTGWIDITYSDNQTDYIGTVGVVDTVSKVDSVSSVDKINVPKMDVHGTEYIPDQDGKVFIQLLDDDYQPISDSSCFTSIYYPDGNIFKYQQAMSYLGEGIYDYDFITPFQAGVYPVSAFCTIPEINFTVEGDVNDDFESDDETGGSGWDNNWDFDTNCDTQSTYVYEGTYALECRDDEDPWRRITGDSGYARVDYSFWVRSTSFESGEYGYIIIEDASNVPHIIYTYTDSNDDGIWREITGSLTYEANSFDFDGDILFRLDTSGNIDGSDYYFLDYINLEFRSAVSANASEYQILRGSGEVHVTNENEGGASGEYISLIDYGTLTNETFDGYFYLHYDIISLVSQNKTDQRVQLPIFNAFPCEEVVDVYLMNESGDYNPIPFSKQLLGNRNDRCAVNLEMDLNIGETYDVYIELTNFWRLELLGKHKKATINRNILYDGCFYYQQSEGLSNFTIPLLTRPAETDEFWLSCQYYLQGYYDFNKTIIENFVLDIQGEVNFTEEQMGELEGIYINLLQESNLLWDLSQGILNVWQQGNDYSHTILGGGSQVNYLELFATVSGNQMNYNGINNVPYNVWNYTNRTLTSQRNLWIGGTEYSPDETNGKVVTRLVDNTDTPVDDANCTFSAYHPNNTIYLDSIQMVHVNNTEGLGGVYYIDFNLSGNTGVHPYGIDCEVTGGASPKHYYLLDTYHVFGANRTIQAEENWNYFNRTLTYYPPAEVNYDLISKNVWNFSLGRNLTYYEAGEATVNSTEIAEYVWAWTGDISTWILGNISYWVNNNLNDTQLGETLQQPTLSLG